MLVVVKLIRPLSFSHNAQTRTVRAGADGKVEERKTLGAFHSTKTSGLNFQQLPLANGTAFSKTSRREDNLVRYICTDIMH